MAETGLRFVDLKESLVDAANYCPETALYMLKNGTPSTGTLGERVTAFHRAVNGKSRDVELVRAFIDAGADVNAKSGGGYTALDTAKQWGRPEIVELLIKNGAKVGGK